MKRLIEVLWDQLAKHLGPDFPLELWLVEETEVRSQLQEGRSR